MLHLVCRDSLGLEYVTITKKSEFVHKHDNFNLKLYLLNIYFIKLNSFKLSKIFVAQF